MITNNDKLEIFENFQIDRNLPKFAKQREVYKQKSKLGSEDSDDMDEEWSNERRLNIVGSSGSFIVGNPTILKNPESGFWSWLSHLWSWLFHLFIKSTEPIEKIPTLSIEDFFSSVKNSSKELEIVQSRAIGYDKAIERAKQAGQTALYESLVHGLAVYRSESQLVAIESCKYLTEIDIWCRMLLEGRLKITGRSCQNAGRVSTISHPASAPWLDCNPQQF